MHIVAPGMKTALQCYGAYSNIPFCAVFMHEKLYIWYSNTSQIMSPVSDEILI